jgi:hypothetical protein
MEFQKIWIEQCEAVRGIQEDYGIEKSMGYRIGEKLLNFLEVAERDPVWRAEVPAFVAEIKDTFEPRQLREFFDTPRLLGALGHADDDEGHPALAFSDGGRGDRPRGCQESDDVRVGKGVAVGGGVRTAPPCFAGPGLLGFASPPLLGILSVYAGGNSLIRTDMEQCRRTCRCLQHSNPTATLCVAVGLLPRKELAWTRTKPRSP